MSWTLIEHQALTSSAASVTLGSGGTIPQTYKTLKLVVSARQDSTGAGNQFTVAPNATTTNLSYRLMYGSGQAAASTSGTTATAGFPDGSGETANTFSSTEITYPNYAATNANKPWSVDNVMENNGTFAYQALVANLWSSNTAITSLLISPTSGNWVSGSTFTLYGLA